MLAPVRSRIRLNPRPAGRTGFLRASAGIDCLADPAAAKTFASFGVIVRPYVCACDLRGGLIGATLERRGCGGICGHAPWATAAPAGVECRVKHAGEALP